MELADEIVSHCSEVIAAALCEWFPASDPELIVRYITTMETFAKTARKCSQAEKYRDRQWCFLNHIETPADSPRSWQTAAAR
jgi:hypothetical protein